MVFLEPIIATNCGKGRVREHDSGWCVGNDGKTRVVYSGRRREEGGQYFTLPHIVWQ